MGGLLTNKFSLLHAPHKKMLYPQNRNFYEQRPPYVNESRFSAPPHKSAA